jgi:hypothetical protein
MTKWKYISTHPQDFREERKISETWGLSKHKPPRRKENPKPTTPYVTTQRKGGYFHAWEEWLNLLGSQGWEVCSAGGYGWGTRGDVGSEFIVILKQEID